MLHICLKHSLFVFVLAFLLFYSLFTCLPLCLFFFVFMFFCQLVFLYLLYRQYVHIFSYRVKKIWRWIRHYADKPQIYKQRSLPGYMVNKNSEFRGFQLKEKFTSLALNFHTKILLLLVGIVGASSAMEKITFTKEIS